MNAPSLARRANLAAGCPGKSLLAGRHARAMNMVRSPGRRRRPWLYLAAWLVTVAFLGCTSGIGVRKVTQSPLLADWYASAVENRALSPRTQQTLRELDLAQRYYAHPLDAFEELQARVLRVEDPEVVFALAEIAYHLGRDAEHRHDSEAVAYYYLCAGYAYHFLFDPGVSPGEPEIRGQQAANTKKNADAVPGASAPGLLIPDSCPLTPVFDPRFRLACDLYNRGLSRCIATAQQVGRLDPRQILQLPTSDGTQITLSVAHHGFPWQPEEFGPFLFCADYEVMGLDNQHRGYGLGVPLIGRRVHAIESAPGQAFYPNEVSFPVTAFFRFEGSLADLNARRAGRLELYNPLSVHHVTCAGRPVPLETDLTTPLAYFLGRTDLGEYEYTGFLRPETMQNRTGIYFFEPYQKGKIPVLMIHGLMSSPVTWAPLFNDLRADPELNARYQFWFYRYPTGNPYLLTAADLRQALATLRAELDPHHEDPAFARMVLVGHSMGGLIAKLLTQGSGGDFWDLVSKQPFDKLKGSPEDRDQVQRVFFFQKETGVQRVIFLATPHHGSKLLPSPPARLLARLVRLPARLRTVTADLTKANPNLWANAEDGGRLPTSIDLLNPGSPELELLAARPAPPGILYHSIIGVAYGQVPDGSDGVVAYRSAHIDGVRSELVVPAEHTQVQGYPASVLEVRRILYEHLRMADGKVNGAVIPAAGP
jgi:pimeloyl-ACP methyl ester carboxylesterase